MKREAAIEQMDSVGRRIHVGDIVTHATVDGHAIDMSVGVVTRISERGIHANVVETVWAGRVAKPRRGNAPLRHTFFHKGTYVTITGMTYDELCRRFGQDFGYISEAERDLAYHILQLEAAESVESVL